MTSSKLDYAIVIPSRRRSHNMPIVRSLLPTATICVEDSEADDYLPFVPKEKLLVHPHVEGAGPGVFNWITEHVDAPILVRCDDDLENVQSNTGSKRRIVDPEQILAIIENAMRACHDLGLTGFCWSRTPNTTVIHPEYRPIVPTQMMAGILGVMGAARSRKQDIAMSSRCDLDFSLDMFLKDRCIYADIRYFFDFGLAGEGRGGGVGLTTTEKIVSGTKLLRQRWGRYVSEQRRPGGSSRPVKIRPNLRTNSRAQR